MLNVFFCQRATVLSRFIRLRLEELSHKMHGLKITKNSSERRPENCRLETSAAKKSKHFQLLFPKDIPGLCFGWPQHSPIFGPPVWHQIKAITETVGKLEIHGPKHFCDLCQTVLRHGNSDRLMSFKKKSFRHFHVCDLRRRCIDTEYDRAKVPQHNGNDPRPPLVV